MPYTVKFENGMEANFEKEPTAADISDAEKSLGIYKKTGLGGVVKGVGSALSKAKDATTGFTTGVAKGIARTALGGGELVERAGGYLGEKLSGVPAEEGLVTKIRAKIKPKTTAEKVGMATESVGEFLVPGLAETKAPKAVSLGGKALEYGGNLLKEVGTMTGITALQEPGDVKQIERNAIAAGAIPIVSSVLKPLAKASGLKIETALVKPSTADIKDGFKASNIFKYDLGGTLSQSAQKTNQVLTSLSEELKTALGATKKKLNLFSELNSVEKELAANKAKTFGANSKIKQAIDFFKEEIRTVVPNGKVDLSSATEIKRSVGKLGAWQFGMRDPEANAIEKVANAYYTRLKTAIEKASPGNVKEINKKLSDIIPIENALIRRLPIAERNNIISLGDIASLIPAFSSPSNWWLFAINKLAKSGITAKKLMEVSKPEAGGLLKAGILSVPKSNQATQ